MKKEEYEQKVEAAKQFFELAVERHLQQLESNPDYKAATDRLQFSEGRELQLKVRVTSPEMSQFLMKWLHSDDELFGCQLETISWGMVDKEEFKLKVMQMIGQL